jgi:hypothetical protein
MRQKWDKNETKMRQKWDKFYTVKSSKLTQTCIKSKTKFTHTSKILRVSLLFTVEPIWTIDSWEHLGSVVASDKKMRQINETFLI